MLAVSIRRNRERYIWSCYVGGDRAFCSLNNWFSVGPNKLAFCFYGTKI